LTNKSLSGLVLLKANGRNFRLDPRIRFPIVPEI
jgi:hypothetical protein